MIGTALVVEDITDAAKQATTEDRPCRYCIVSAPAETPNTDGVLCGNAEAQYLPIMQYAYEGQALPVTNLNQVYVRSISGTQRLILTPVL